MTYGKFNAGTLNLNGVVAAALRAGSLAIDSESPLHAAMLAGEAGHGVLKVSSKGLRLLCGGAPTPLGRTPCAVGSSRCACPPLARQAIAGKRTPAYGVRLLGSS